MNNLNRAEPSGDGPRPARCAQSPEQPSGQAEEPRQSPQHRAPGQGEQRCQGNSTPNISTNLLPVATAKEG